MKAVFTICLSLLLLAGVMAQKKPSINKAKALWEQGALDEAKTMIDACTTYEKTMDDGLTWYYRGLIYASIDTTSNETFKALEENPLKVAMESFSKADEIDPEGKKYIIFSGTGLITKTQHISGYYSYYFNRAIEEYGEDDFESASISFETATQIVPRDTTALNNAGYAAQASDNNPRAIEMFTKSIEFGANALPLYLNLISLHQQAENMDQALEVIAKAKKVYPADNGLNRLEISILINQGKQEEALSRLKLAIEKEPQDAILRFVLGILYEELKDFDNALLAYEEAIAINDHYDSNFNRAVILFNKANALYKEKGLLGYSAADQKKAKELDPKIKEAFQKSLPAWENVYALKPQERAALESMVFIYAYLGEEKKADKIEAELNALSNEGDN